MTEGQRQFAGSVVRHGTESGWTLQQTRGQDPCAPCWEAKSAADKRRMQAPDKVLKNRRNAKAQARAHQRLSHMYPTLYAALYEEEKQRLEQEAESLPFASEGAAS